MVIEIPGAGVNIFSAIFKIYQLANSFVIVSPSMRAIIHFS